MKPKFKEKCIIYIDRLLGEKTEKIHLSLPPAFINIEEPDLQFNSPICIQGKAYLAQDYLVICLEVHTDAQMLCSICNEKVKVFIDLTPFYHAEALKNIQSQTYDYSTPLRETILLEVPSYVECKGKCPHREKLKKYLGKGDFQFPFADL